MQIEQITIVRKLYEGLEKKNLECLALVIRGYITSMPTVE